MTKQRRMILDIVQSSCEHMTADQIYAKAKEQMPTIAVGTVYRNLNLMVRDGEVRRIPSADGPDHFDRTLTRHDHVVCVCCGKMKDLCIADLTNQIEGALGEGIEGYHLDVRYLCRECRKAKLM